MRQVRGFGILALLLLAAVAAPTACVLWFLNAAVENERLAVRQKLEEAYRTRLTEASRNLESFWQEKARRIRNLATDRPPSVAFAELVRSGACDSAVIYGPDNEILYPAAQGDNRVETQEDDHLWAEARNTEYEDSNPATAAALYGDIAANSQNPDSVAEALLAQARCLREAGLQEEALAILTGPLAQETYNQARDEHGRLISVSARLRGLELLRDTGASDFKSSLKQLSDRLRSYQPPPMSPSQRRFAMRRLQELAPDSPEFPTLPAEGLAARYLRMDTPPPSNEGLRKSGLSGVWCFSPAGSSVVALFDERNFLPALHDMIPSEGLTSDASIALLTPDTERGDRSPLLEAPAGADMPGWSLVLYLEGPDPFATAAERQITTYLWAGILSIGAILIIGLVVGGYLLRQMRLTRLKNDFIATVSHELKTPLSSMRVLVDTLREGRCKDENQQWEYLDMVARENERLSHLIDNFLSFSRMERDKQSLDFERVDPAEIVETAAEVVRARFASSVDRFTVEQTDNLAEINADRGAIITVLLNLIDNAFKYSGEDAEVTLRAYEGNGGACFEVEDNGVGMSRREIRKAFDRFYQADRRLSREAGGCGLGLSIVKFIVDAHGGSIDVESEPGKGSIFTVRVPSRREDGNA